MKKINKILAFLIISFFLSACNAVKEGFSSQKKTSSDEFFVEKKAPLVMPPNYGEMPTPNKNIDNEEKKNENIKKLISQEDSKNTETDEMSEISNSLEKNVLDKIKN